MISIAPPFVLRLSKDERRVFQQNRFLADELTEFNVQRLKKKLRVPLLRLPTNQGDRQLFEKLKISQSLFTVGHFS